jgi:hypothetical protein
MPQVTRMVGTPLVRRVVLAALLVVALVVLVHRTDDVPPPAVRSLGEYSSDNIDTPGSQVTAQWIGYGPGWRDGYRHSFSGYHLLKIEGGDVVPAVSVDRSHPFDPAMSHHAAQFADVQQADAALWLALAAGYEAPVPVDTNAEAAVVQLAVWRLTNNLKLTNSDFSKHHLDAEGDLVALVDGLVKVTRDSSHLYEPLPPNSFSITSAWERKPRTVQIIGILNADRKPLPNQTLVFKYAGGSVMAQTNSDGRAAVEVPILDETASRVRILWRGVVKAGTIFGCRCPAGRKSQTLMTIRDAVIERSVLVPIKDQSLS